MGVFLSGVLAHRPSLLRFYVFPSSFIFCVCLLAGFSVFPYPFLPCSSTGSLPCLSPLPPMCFVYVCHVLLFACICSRPSSVLITCFFFLQCLISFHLLPAIPVNSPVYLNPCVCPVLFFGFALSSDSLLHLLQFPCKAS